MQRATRRVSAINCGRVAVAAAARPEATVAPTGTAPPLQIDAAIVSSPGPALTTTRRPRSTSPAATAPYRSGGQRLAPQPAPGVMSAMGFATPGNVVASHAAHQASASASTGSSGAIFATPGTES